MIEKGRLESVTAVDVKSKSKIIELNKSTDGQFKLSNILSDTTYEIDADIFSFNKYTNKGKLKVLFGQDIPDGEYGFEVLGDQKMNDYISSMEKNRIKATVNVVSKDGLLVTQSIIKLLILKVGF